MEAGAGQRLARQVARSLETAGLPTAVVDLREPVVEHSEIYGWFGEDFVRDAQSVRAYLMRFAPPDLAPKLRDAQLVTRKYDWSLNDVER